MKRIGLKVGAIVCGSVAFALFAVLVATLSSDATSPQLVFGDPRSRIQVAAVKGCVIFCDDFGNREVIEAVDQSRLIRPSVAKDRQLSFPGFSFRHITFTSGLPIWSVSISLLIPFLLTALPGGFLWWRFRTSKGTASVQATPGTAQTEQPRDDSDASALDRAA